MVDRDICCGCRACERVCPKQAVSFIKDEKGFAYPVIDKDKCINCNMCQKVCPLHTTHVGVDAEPDIYALQSKDKARVALSSSGAAFSLLSDYVLEKKGIVFGVVFDEEYIVRHVSIDSKDLSYRFCTSKYVESDISAVYEEIIDAINSYPLVLLSGTPCQIAGVTNYLKLKNIDTDRLITCDNICHGVPSSMVWQDYLSIIKERYIPRDDKIIGINMRSKKQSWSKQIFEVALEKNDISDVINDFSFNRLFLSLNINRPSCFNCHFSSYDRISDFTLGDFWNVEQAGINFDVSGGVNVVLVNTDRGREIFNYIKDKAYSQSVSKQTAWQPHLEYSAHKPAKYDEFWTNYNNASDKELIMRKYNKGSALEQLIRKVSPLLRATGLYAVAGKLYKIVFVKNRN